jgi:hypothetical protein
MLTDVTIEYYAMMERCMITGVPTVFDLVARALQLDDAEPEHLFDLARIAHGGEEPSGGASRRSGSPVRA